MRILIATDSFKGTMTSAEVCNITSEFIGSNTCYDTCAVPVADGGEGTLDAFAALIPGLKRVAAKVKNSWMEDVFVPYLYSPLESTAVIEMAAAAGFGDAKATPAGCSAPMDATTYGVGQLILDAVNRGAKKIIVGLGGSCTNDGGCGMAAALGVKFYRSAGCEPFVPVGRTLSEIARIDASESRMLSDDVEILGLCDVTNPLCGPEGAAHVFAPQKGASAHEVVLLDEGLAHLAEICDNRELQLDDASVISMLPGAGAAGGLGFGLCAFAGGRLMSGIEYVLTASDFMSALEGADFVITGEGHFDSQSLNGKVVSGICAAAKKTGVPVIILCGFADEMAASVLDNLGIVKVFETGRFSMDKMTQSQAHSLAAFQLRETLIDVSRYLNL